MRPSVISPEDVLALCSYCPTDGIGAGGLESVDLRELCIRAPDPGDDGARRCYPTRADLSGDLSVIKSGDLVTLNIQDGIITSAEKVGPPTHQRYG